MPDVLADNLKAFRDFLVQQTPKFDEEIVRDIRPESTLLTHVRLGTAKPGTPPIIVQDRFRHVYPDVTHAWSPVPYTGLGCVSYQPVTARIGFGAERIAYGAVQQRWRTPVFDLNQIIHSTNAIEHIEQIVSDILRPATVEIMNSLVRRSWMQWAKRRVVANSSIGVGSRGTFNFEWAAEGEGSNRLIYLDTTVAPTDVFMLTPSMLQRLYQPLMAEGYGGRNPYKEAAPYVTLVTDVDTCWHLEHLCGGGADSGLTPNVAANWRFELFSAASDYFKYGYHGRIGNFLIVNDPHIWRFKYIGTVTKDGNTWYRYQLILPYRNVVTTGAGSAPGLGSEPNPDWYASGLFQISFIPHPDGLELSSPKVVTPGGTNYRLRQFAGEWIWLDRELTDENGNLIADEWGQFGAFGAWFRYWVRPVHYEFMALIFHRVASMNVVEIAPPDQTEDIGPQSYTSAPPTCDQPVTPPYNGPYYVPGTSPTGPVQPGQPAEQVGGGEEGGGEGGGT